MSKKKNKKHFIIYYKRGTGTYVVTEPRPWARENSERFENPEPRTKEIVKYLIDNYNFKKEVFNDDKIQVIFNLDPDLEI